MIKVMPFRSIAVILSIVVLTSCGSGGSNASSTDQTYNNTKTMVLDILKSDDGKKAMMTAVQGTGDGGGPQIKQLTAGDAKMLQVAVKNVLTSPENKNMMEVLVKNPQFAGDFAKAIQQDTKQIHKDLMKDPEYQKYMLDLMKNPQFQTVLMDSAKTIPFRQQMKMVTQETLQSPLFQGQLLKLMETAVSSYMQKEQTPKAGVGAASQSGGGGGGGQSSGGSSDQSGSGSGSGSDQSGGSGDQSQDDQKKKDQPQ
jgi:spore germination protein D